MKHLSTKEAMKQAFKDMKKAKVNFAIFNDAKNIRVRPENTIRLGLVGL